MEFEQGEMQAVEPKAKKTRTKKETEELLGRIKRRFKMGLDAESLMRENALSDDRFYMGDQWIGTSKSDRESQGRPALQINKLPQFVKQVTNELRMNRPQIRVIPKGDGASERIAKKLTGLVRHIQVNSKADLAYDTSGEQAVIGGYGYYRVRADYVDDGSFEQELLIERIQSRFSVILDPNRKQPDASDMKWAFIFDEVSEDEFKEDYPAAAPISFDFNSDGDLLRYWVGAKTVKIAEYFEIRFEPKKLCLVAGNIRLWEDELEEAGNPQVLQERIVQKPCVYWYKTNGLEILEESEWGGSLIPVILVVGEERIVDGKIDYCGIVRNAKDPQRMVNYWWTAFTESVALSPLAPYIGYEGQFVNPAKWNDSNRVPVPFLEAKVTVDAANGTILSLPQRQSFSSVPTGIDRGLALASEAIKETTGIYNASLGATSNETSGKAINARKAEGDTATFNFPDNVVRAQRYCGQVLIDAIPHYYDSARIIRIIGEDGTVEEMLPVNGHPGTDMENPVDEIYDITIGRYDVVVDSGPSFQTRRQEAASAMTEFVRSFPQAAPLIGDLIAKAQDWPGSEEIAQRLKAMLPPQLQNLGKQGKLPPEAQQMIAGLQNQLEKMNGELAQTKAELESDNKANATEHYKIDSQMLMERYKTDTDNATKLEIAKITTQTPESIQLLAQEVISLRSLFEQMGQPVNAPAPGPQPEIPEAPQEAEGEPVETGQPMGEP